MIWINAVYQIHKKHDEWEFVNVYTDEGITAVNTNHRDGFNQMTNDALDGKISLPYKRFLSYRKGEGGLPEEFELDRSQ